MRTAHRGDDRQDVLARLGDDIRRARHRAGLSQAQLANVAGVHQCTISRLEHGRLPESRLIIYARIHVALFPGHGRRVLPPDGSSALAMRFDACREAGPGD